MGITKREIVFMLLLLLALVAFASGVSAAPFLISDATTQTRVTHCAMYSDAAGTTLIREDVTVVDGTGERCNVDLAGMVDPVTRVPLPAWEGKTVYVAYRDSSVPDRSPLTAYTFPRSTLAAPVNVRISP